MELSEYLRFVAALGFVLGLIGLLAWIAKRSGLMTGGIRPSASQRLAVVEVKPIDAKRRLVLLRRDGTEHLLLIGGGSDIVLESGIQHADDGAS